jgi:hypothetical protein
MKGEAIKIGKSFDASREFDLIVGAVKNDEKIERERGVERGFGWNN